MSDSIQREMLSNFFSSYFHQDWFCDDDSTESVVREFSRTVTPSQKRELGEAIRAYSTHFDNDEELEKDLFASLGCYYRPSGDGLSAKAWLNGVADQLLMESEQTQSKAVQ